MFVEEMGTVGSLYNSFGQGYGYKYYSSCRSASVQWISRTSWTQERHCNLWDLLAYDSLSHYCQWWWCCRSWSYTESWRDAGTPTAVADACPIMEDVLPRPVA